MGGTGQWLGERTGHKYLDEAVGGLSSDRREKAVQHRQRIWADRSGDQVLTCSSSTQRGAPRGSQHGQPPGRVGRGWQCGAQDGSGWLDGLPPENELFAGPVTAIGASRTQWPSHPLPAHT